MTHDVRTDSTSQLHEWVRPQEGRILGRIYLDQDVFDLEIERIWKRSWLFAGHESEVPAAGDFVTRTVGTVPLIICRTSEGDVSVLINRCAHRANLVCSHECGNASAFQCAYHGWTYRQDGGLIGVPYQQAYGNGFDKGEHGLSLPARVATYRGFVFVSYSPEGPGIEEHLGNAREPLDHFIDLSPTGRLRLDAGYNRLRLDCNWKMYAENSSDNYHANFVHASAFGLSEHQRKMAAAISRDASKAVVWALGNGHSYLDFREEQRVQGGVLRSGNATADAAAEHQYLTDLVARIGKERATTLLQDGPPTVFIFPNMFIIQQDVRRLEPVSAGDSRLYQHPALLDGVSDEINLQRLGRHQAAYGPAGFVMSDDLEIFSRNQRAVQATPDEWLLLARGLHREEPSDDGSIRSHVTDETGMRGMWREYLKLMDGHATA